MKLASLFVEKYPYEAEPDEAVNAPHHFYIGAIVAWFGFQYVWPYYPEVGATMALIGLTIAADDVIDHAFGGYIRDATERYLGVRAGMPLDYLFNRFIRRWLKP